MEARTYRREPRPVGEALTQWLRANGLNRPQRWAALARAVADALPAAWGEHVQLCQVAGAAVCLAVDSAPLLAELQAFHAARLKTALQAAAPRQGVRQLRFVLADPGTGPYPVGGAVEGG